MVASGATRANQVATGSDFVDQRAAQPVSAEMQGQFLFHLPDGVGSFELASRLSVNEQQSVFAGESASVPDSERGLPRQVNADGFLENARDGNTSGLLVLGYGHTRNLPARRTSPAPKDLAKERIQSLFAPVTLIGTDFYLHLHDRDPQLAQGFTRALKHALLSEPELLPEIVATEDKGDEVIRFMFGRKHSAPIAPTLLSQGYQATIAWIADLIGHAIWDAGRALMPEEIEALVLIDEIDLHLHPHWQTNLVRLLKKLFPKVQFITTTHSPMILTGVEPDEIVTLGMDARGDVIAKSTRDQPKPPRLMTGSELYQAYFGIDDIFPDALGDALLRYGMLVGDPGRSMREQQEMLALRARLQSGGIDPGWQAVPIDPALQRPDDTP